MTGTREKSPEVPTPLLLVRATVNLVGLPVGHAACVDPARESISEWLSAGYLVALPQDQQHHCDGIDATEENP